MIEHCINIDGNHWVRHSFFFLCCLFVCLFDSRGYVYVWYHFCRFFVYIYLLLAVADHRIWFNWLKDLPFMDRWTMSAKPNQRHKIFRNTCFCNFFRCCFVVFLKRKGSKRKWIGHTIIMVWRIDVNLKMWTNVTLPNDGKYTYKNREREREWQLKCLLTVNLDITRRFSTSMISILNTTSTNMKWNCLNLTFIAYEWN